MSNDLVILEQLESDIGKKLRLIPFKDIMALGSGGAYSVDEKDKESVVGLNLAGLKITQFPLSILKFRTLRRLSLRNTGLIELPKGINQLKNLQEFALTNNNLKHLPSEILDLNLELTVGAGSWRGKFITLKGNPLESPPPKIIQQGKQAIVDYFKSLKVDEMQTLSFDKAPTLSKLLYDLLTDKFNEEELKTLCFFLDISYDDLGGAGRAGKARELILYVERHERLLELEAIIIKERPTTQEYLKAHSFSSKT